jgi:phage terminase large subunit-like protein
MDSFDGRPVYAGLDLSSVNDLTALVLMAPDDEGVWSVRPTFWLPAVGLAERSRKDRVPYDTWAAQGALETTPGAAVEYEYVALRMRDLFDEHDIRQVAFDRWGWTHFEPWLRRVGFDDERIGRFKPFGQGFVSMSPALRQLETLLLAGKLRHGGHPVLSMCAANAVVNADPAGNRKLAKDKSAGRIDGMVALAMAAGVAAAHIETPAEVFAEVW